MATSVRRSRPVRRRAAFGLRQLTLCFGLVGIAVLAVGLMVRTAVSGAAEHPVAAALVGLVVVGLVIAVVRSLPARRRALQSAAGSPVDAPAEGLDEATPAESVLVAEDDPVEGDPVEEAPRAEDYARMDAEEFEGAVAALCERDGCGDVQVVGGANDLGADIVATAPGGRPVVIQCKRYGDLHKVGSQEMQRFGGTCFAVHGAEVAALVTTSAFTDPAAEYAEQCGILCFDGQALAEWSAGTGPAPWERPEE